MSALQMFTRGAGMSAAIKRPVCVLCDGCQCVLAGNGTCIPRDAADDNELITGFPSNQEADQAAVAAGWSVTPGNYELGGFGQARWTPSGIVTFNVASHGEHFCPTCQKQAAR